jgi:protein-L-isoaspartate(D-aspartate) O-methyltransferase
MSSRGRDEEYAIAKRRMVELIRSRGVEDESVLSAMATVPRHEFVPEHLRDIAYEDGPLPIGDGQTISQPYIVAFMCEAAMVGQQSRVLEIGTGSGYSAAVLAEMGVRVFTIERNPPMAAKAQERLRELGYREVAVRAGDGTEGWPEEAPFDRIIVTAGGPRVPDDLVGQLGTGGRLVIPVGPQMARQSLMRLTRAADGSIEEESLGAVAFVPLIGRHGWPG